MKKVVDEMTGLVYVQNTSSEEKVQYINLIVFSYISVLFGFTFGFNPFLAIAEKSIGATGFEPAT